jgi:hypothetical protein
MKDAGKSDKFQYWVFTGSDRTLLNIATERLFKLLKRPVQKISGKTSALSILHTCGELDLMADAGWVLVLENVAKVQDFDLFKEGIGEALAGNYLVIIGEQVDEGVQRWVSECSGRIITCEKIENRVDFLKAVEQIFVAANISLTESSLNALLALTGFSTGAVLNATRLLREYYDPSGAHLELGYNEIVEVVPALNFEDVFSVITEVIYGNMKQALDYYHKLTERDSEIHFLFMDRMLDVLRDIWLFRRMGELTTEQQEDLELDKRTYRKIKNQTWVFKDEDLYCIYKVGLSVLEMLQSTPVKPMFIVEAFLIYSVRVLRGEKVVEFPVKFFKGDGVLA